MQYDLMPIASLVNSIRFPSDLKWCVAVLHSVLGGAREVAGSRDHTAFSDTTQNGEHSGVAELHFLCLAPRRARSNRFSEPPLWLVLDSVVPCE
jgi:hypothetical protein